MCRGERQNLARFLYCPRRFGSVVGVCRHLIIKEGPRRIVVQRIPHGRCSVLFPFLVPVAYVDRHQLERAGWDCRWVDPVFADDPLCPLGRLYPSRDAARFALALWAFTTLNLHEADRASLN